ncbi:MAG: hypothetical protein ABI210_02380 [Abditibacteriaceae bacterium]
MLCHIHNISNPESFLERLTRTGCDGVLLEVHLGEDDPRLSRKVGQLCKKLDLQYWMMPIVTHPSEKHRAWMLDVSSGAPRPMPRDGMLDLLSPQSADYLFGQLKKYVDKTPDGIFLQTPFGDSGEPFPWTLDFEKYFSSQHGYNFQEKWHSLTSTTGADDAKVRQDYWETLNTEINGFLDQCSSLSSKGKSAFRHNVMEPELAALSVPQEAIWRRRASHSIEIIPFGNWPQLLKSTFDCFINDALHVAVSLPEEFNEEPAKRYFQLTKNARDILNQGENVARVGLLFPLRSARTHYHPDSHRYPRWIGEDFSRMMHYLDSMHYDYRLLEESELQKPPCELLVIPSITAIATESWAAIESWIKRGGKVACAGLLPRWSERGRDGELEDRISRATKQTLQDVYDGYLAWEQGTALPPYIGYPIFGEDISGGRLCSYTPHLNHDAEDARLRLSQIFRESLQSDFSSQNSDVIYRHFQDDKTERFAIYNNSDQTQQFICRAIASREETPHKISQCILKNGQTSAVPVWSLFSEIEGGGVSLTITLAPHELRIYEMNFTEEQWHLWRANFNVEEIDSDEIHGYAQESIRPFCVQERDGKTIQWTAPKVLLPTPIWMDENDWVQDKSTFSGDFYIPAEWNAHRVMLEIRPEGAAVQLRVNHQDCGLTLTPLFLFDISAAITPGESNHFELQLWRSEEATPTPARLVAWPKIDLPVKKIDNS